jgi:glycogen synthase
MATKRPRKVVLYVEGTTDDTNGDLRQGFENLLKKELAGKMPSIKLGDGITQTIDKFKNTGGVKFLLIDLDGVNETKEKRLKNYDLPTEKTFFMVQAMEAWFLSQPEMLNEFYKKDLKIPKKHAREDNKTRCQIA